MDRELVIVLDFGGQYNQLIARRVRECNVYCEVHPYTLSLDKIREMNPKGIIFTGGPNSVYGEDSPRCPKEIFEMGIPILGICYGSQLMSYMLGGSVKTAPVSEYGKTEVAVDTESALFKNVSPSTICWMSHTDYIEKAPEKFKITAHTPVCPVAGMENAEKKLYAVQFHPEVMHTQEGTKMLSNFVYDICGCTGDWKMDSFVETTIHQIREKVVFEEEAKKIGAVDFLVQGTIYPDVIESGLGKSAVIKSHHNVGGLPDCVDFKEIIEPLRLLFKDEVRRAGLELGIPEYLVYRQPFPGPGLGVRIVGEVTPEKVRIVQDADAIYREELAKAGCDKGLGQFFAALTNMRSVGVMGDERTYDYAVALRAVITSDFMTAEAAEIPFDVLFKVMTRVINEVKGVNRVLYDLTSKPPGTIELE